MTENEIKNSKESAIDFDEIIEKGKQGKLSDSDLEIVEEEMDFDLDSIDKLYDAFLNILEK
jgi:hypothetical protein